MEISDKWLAGIGGWKAMKEARALLGAGAVISARVGDSGSIIEGVVAEGRKKWACGLKIASKTDVENLCGCAVSRRDGQICPHSLAAALSAIAAPPEEEPEPEPAAREQKSPIAVRVEFGPRLAEDWKKGRLPLIAREDPDRAPDASDDQIIRWLEEVGAGRPTSEQPLMLSLDRRQAGELLQHAAGGARRCFSGGEALSVGTNRARLLVTVSGDGDLVRLQSHACESGTSLLTSERTAWMLNAEAGRLVPLQLSSIADAEALFAEDGAVIERPVDWFIGALPDLESSFQLESGGDDFLERIAIRVAATEFVLKCEGSLNHLAARLECCPVTTEGVRLCVREENLIPDPDDPLRFYTIDASAVAQAESTLHAMRFSGPDKDGQFVLRGEDAILGFFAGGLPRLEADNSWSVEIGERFGYVTRDVQRIEPVAEVVSSGEDWFSFQLDYVSGDGERVPRAEIQRLLQTGQHSIKLPNGKRAALDLSRAVDLSEVLYDCSPDQEAGNEFRVSSAHASYLRESVSRWEGRLASESAGADPDFGDLAELLRDYQKDGVRWLYDHVASAGGGILADEMGLGKTLQTLATISAIESAAALVVCPASLIHNWVNEARRFVPDIEVNAITGPKRGEELAALGAEGISITSYGLLVRDLEHYQPHAFAAVVLDEASAIRNPKTRAAKAVRALNARGRIALTGTPVENSVRDLWSIMEFVRPGYLGTAEEFKTRYEQPISQSPKTATAERDRLRRRMRPCLLRRTKREVAPELPEKIESVRLCELSPPQAELYRTFLRESQNNISDLIKKQGFEKSRMHVLSALLRLRQICCDSRLLPGFEDRPEGESGKLAALLETLDEAVEGGHRVLVFSQFAKMLGLLRSSVADRSLECCYLDGQTPGEARASEVERFQSGEVPVFLISLKAGGYGLNLTAADTVIHYDPWWNPAVEAQATDRAHRIGQENPVTVIKMIAQGTVEERILSLQRRKRSVIDAATDDEAPMMRGLTQADVEEMIAADG